MECERNRPRPGESKPFHFCCLSIFFYFFYFFLLFFVLLGSSSSTTTSLDRRCPLSAKADVHFQEFEGVHSMKMAATRTRGVQVSLSFRKRRYLSGPGSSPPRCTSKCGKCTPCKPVHVPVPPGTPVTAEYYPEAWRCKCGNKLYMP